jgi:hypothetical protein
MIETVLTDALQSRQVDDPLLRFVESVENGTCCESGETVNLSSLFSSAGAVHDRLHVDPSHSESNVRIENVGRLAALATSTGWLPQLPDSTLRTGILLLRPSTPTSNGHRTAEAYRRAFQERGVALSAYGNGLLRLSMPATPLTSAEVAIVENALTSVR